MGKGGQARNCNKLRSHGAVLSSEAEAFMKAGLIRIPLLSKAVRLCPAQASGSCGQWAAIMSTQTRCLILICTKAAFGLVVVLGKVDSAQTLHLLSVSLCRVPKRQFLCGSQLVFSIWNS